MKRPFVKRKRRDGITLLEVILAIAILGYPPGAHRGGGSGDGELQSECRFDRLD